LHRNSRAWESNNVSTGRFSERIAFKLVHVAGAAAAGVFAVDVSTIGLDFDRSLLPIGLAAFDTTYAP
jgi:hypothetical protein